MKKILLTLALCLATVGVYSSITYTDEQGVMYEVTGAVGKVTGYVGKLPNVVISSPVKNGDDEFYVTTIAKNAFDSKTGLESIVLPADLETIEEQAFYGCSMLYKVVFAEGTQLLEIGDRAFYNCTSLIDITITVRKSGSGADEVSLPKIKSNGINFYNFGNVPNIGFVNKTGRDIRGYPFGARNVNGYVDGYLLYAPDDSTKTKVMLCSHAARGTVIIPESTTNIASQAFADCEQMTSVIIPASLSSIESRIFIGCKGLTSIVCKCKTPPVSPYYDDKTPEFVDVNKSIPVYVPEGSIEAYKNAKGWSQFSNYHAWTAEIEDELSKVTLTLSVNNPAMGNVRGAGVYTSGQDVTIEAIPAEGYKFVQWSDNNAENPRMLLLTSDLTLTAIFASNNTTDQFLLTLFVNDAKMGEVSGSGLYSLGETAIIEATAKEGYVFKQWSDGNKLSSRSILITTNLTLTAEFEKKDPTVIEGTTILDLKKYKASSYNCAYFDWWYFGYTENKRFGFAIFDENGKDVAFTVMSLEEADLCAYLDDISFPANQYEDRDDEAHYYMSTYWVLNSPDGVRWAGGADVIPPACVYENKDNSGNSLYALRPGTYYFRVMELIYDSETGKVSMGSGYDQIKFMLTGTVVENLKAEVAEDKKTATITWDAPTLPYGAHLYMSVQTGSNVAFDNYAQDVSPQSPLTVGVVEGRTYSVTAQYINNKKEPVGEQVKIYFTVGTNAYIPTDLEASVTQDTVMFSWDATTKADYYHVRVYQNGITYASYSTQEQKLTKQIPSGTYTWEVAAYEKDDELYYPLTEYVKGNEFTTVSAPISEGTKTLNVWGMDAVLWEEDHNKNRFGWLVEFSTGTKNGTGYPMPWIYIYADREYALSGTYSPALGNLAISSTPGEETQMNMDGTQSNTIQATDAELKLEFEGFDSEYSMVGYSIPYYSGYLKMTLADGNSYYAQLSNLICPAYPADEWMSGKINTVISMTGEDSSIPSYQISYDVTPADAGYVEIEGYTLTAYPSNGYHFAQWNDGITTNPRTIELTQDTAFIAYFAPDTTGICGKDYALTWAYNASTKTLTISGNGSFDEHMECGIEAKQTMEKLVINEGVTAIGSEAFSNCQNLTFVQLPASLKTIGEKAFYNCLELTSIYNYRPNPCLIETNTFDKVNTFDCELYVLAESITKYRSEASGWKIFYEIKPIGGTTVDEPITGVETQPNDNHVVVTWPVSTDAATYTIQITKNGIVFCTLIFDASGQLTGIAFAPDRNNRNHAPAAVKTSNSGLRFTVTGLDSGTKYHLTVDAKDKFGDPVASYETNFETLKAPEVTTAIDNVQSDKGQSTKVLRNGQLLILRGDKVYTTTGQEVK